MVVGPDPEATNHVMPPPIAASPATPATPAISTLRRETPRPVGAGAGIGGAETATGAPDPTGPEVKKVGGFVFTGPTGVFTHPGGVDEIG